MGPFRLQILREFYDDRMGIVDFTNLVLQRMYMEFPSFEAIHYCDPQHSPSSPIASQG